MSSGLIVAQAQPHPWTKSRCLTAWGRPAAASTAYPGGTVELVHAVAHASHGRALRVEGPIASSAASSCGRPSRRTRAGRCRGEPDGRLRGGRRSQLPRLRLPRERDVRVAVRRRVPACGLLTTTSCRQQGVYRRHRRADGCVRRRRRGRRRGAHYARSSCWPFASVNSASRKPWAAQVGLARTALTARPGLAPRFAPALRRGRVDAVASRAVRPSAGPRSHPAPGRPCARACPSCCADLRQRSADAVASAYAWLRVLRLSSATTKSRRPRRRSLLPTLRPRCWHARRATCRSTDAPALQALLDREPRLAEISPTPGPGSRGTARTRRGGTPPAPRARVARRVSGRDARHGGPLFRVRGARTGAHVLRPDPHPRRRRCPT